MSQKSFLLNVSTRVRRVRCKSVPEECSTRLFRKSAPQRIPQEFPQECPTSVCVPQESPARVPRKIVFCSESSLTRVKVLDRSVLQECPVPYECPARVPHIFFHKTANKSGPQECPARESKRASQGFSRSVSHKSVPQKCPK